MRRCAGSVLFDKRRWLDPNASQDQPQLLQVGLCEMQPIYFSQLKIWRIRLTCVSCRALLSYGPGFLIFWM
jgi:hypothetical protein